MGTWKAVIATGSLVLAIILTVLAIFALSFPWLANIAGIYGCPEQSLFWFFTVFPSFAFPATGLSLLNICLNGWKRARCGYYVIGATWLFPVTLLAWAIVLKFF